MSDLALHVPKFRCVARLTDWVRRRYIKQRLPADREQVFFKVADKDPIKAAKHVALYAAWVGPLDESLEHLLRAMPDRVMAYADGISRAPWLAKLPAHLHSSLAGDYKLLLRLARHLGGRLSPELEASIVEGCDETHASARLVAYAEIVGPLNEDLERRIAGDHGYVLKYFSILKRHEKELPPWMVNELKGDSTSLYQLARGFIGGRLPEDLENTMDDPGVLYDYARSIVRERLPEHLELVFMKDHRFAVKYAFEVVRAFSDVRLPEELHTSIVMTSFEKPDDQEIKRYVNETKKFEK